MSSVARTAVVAILLTASALVAPATAQRAVGDSAGDGVFSLALTGDAIITRRISPYREPEFLGLVDLVRGADAAFTNLEMLFHDYEGFPMNESGGTYMRADPALAGELAWAGFDLAGMANNHTGDYSVEAMRSTRRYAEAAGLVVAGTGENLYEAREARFLETADGRVALIGVASTFSPHSVASKPRYDVRGRPGLNPLHHDKTMIVTQETLDRLRTALRDIPELRDIGVNPAVTGTSLVLFGTTVRAGPNPGRHTAPNQQDLQEIAAVVRDAAKLADYVVVSIHAHEAGADTNTPAELLVQFAHAMIDAGADVVVGHGPHVLRGIELYKGRPILYSLGNFIFQNETVSRLPYESYDGYDLGSDARVSDFNDARSAHDTLGFPANRGVWESVVARPRWRGKDLLSIDLVPITLGFGKTIPQRGRPMLADQALGRKIVDDLIERSRPFGTTVEWAGGLGVVRVK